MCFPCSESTPSQGSRSAKGGHLLVCEALESIAGTAETAMSFVTVREIFEGLEWHEGIDLRRSHGTQG